MAIVLTDQQYKCLRGHLDAIEKIIGSKDLAGSSSVKQKTPRAEPKRTKKQGIEYYTKLIESGKRGGKPDYLKK